MNDFHDLLYNRRSIRKYKESEISSDSVRLILEAALASPSSKSKMPWQFVVVEDKAMLEKLSQCKEFGARPIAGAAIAIVVVLNPYESDVWVEDGSVAAFAIQLQAQDLGLGSCWIQVRERYDKDGKSAEDNVTSNVALEPHSLSILSSTTVVPPPLNCNAFCHIISFPFCYYLSCTIFKYKYVRNLYVS